MHIAKRIHSHIRRALIRRGMTAPLIQRLKREIVGTLGPADAPYTLLALNAHRFRQDLSILAERFGFRILKLSKPGQSLIPNLYWPEHFHPTSAYFRPAPGSPLAETQGRVRAALGAVLPGFLRAVGADAVLSAAVYYLNDWDYAAACAARGIPYLVLYRECFVADAREQDIQRATFQEIGPFPGSHVIVHNQTMRRLMLETGFLPPDRVSAPGCMRMDPFVERIRATPPLPPDAPKVLTLFSFVHCIGILETCNSWAPDRDAGFVELFDHTHAQVARLAKEHPDITVNIKIKWTADEEWIQHIHIALAKYGLDAADIPNLHILWDEDAQDLIMASQVVVGFGSTTLAEAAVAGKRVIIPCFAEALDPKNADNVLLRDDFDCFDVAHAPDDVTRLALEGFAHPQVPEPVMARRRDIFERYVSSLSADAGAQYAATIRRVIDEARGGRDGKVRDGEPD
ncbi:MAG: hypothetical protein AB7D57_05345 [Desulfovibrionaceae bacterium]